MFLVLVPFACIVAKLVSWVSPVQLNSITMSHTCDRVLILCGHVFMVDGFRVLFALVGGLSEIDSAIMHLETFECRFVNLAEVFACKRTILFRHI